MLSLEELRTLYAAHVAERMSTTARALEETGYSRLLIDAGHPFTYFADDNDAPFHPVPPFAHWEPAYKTDYEVESLADANERAARGHRAAKEAFSAGGSEIEIHHAYVAAVGDMDQALPYPTIIGLDDRSATLHYHGKRGRDGGY